MKAKNIPNILSVIRILLVGLFAFLFFNDFPNYVGAAVGVFFLAGATDVVDGWVARKFNYITNVGKLLDPVADKLMQCTVLLCFAVADMIPWWLPALYISKEILMIIGAAFVFRKKRVVVQSKWYGKAAVCIFYASIFFIFLIERLMQKTVIGSDTASVLLALVYSLMLLSALIAILIYFKDFVKSKTMAKGAESTDNTEVN